MLLAMRLHTIFLPLLSPSIGSQLIAVTSLRRLRRLLTKIYAPVTMRGGLCKKQVLLRCLIFVILYIVVFNVHSLLFGANRSCTTDCPNGRSLPWLPANADLRERARQAALERELSPAKQLRQIPARAFHDHSHGHPMQLERRNSTAQRNGKDIYRDGGVLNYALFNVQGQFKLEPPQYKPRQLPIFPDEVDSPDDDRIWNQMRYVPRKVSGREDTREVLGSVS